MRAILIVGLLIIFSIAGSAQQARENYAGEWQINATRTPTKDLVAGTVWTISIDGDVMKIRRSSIRGEVEMKLLTNGKGESNDIYGTGSTRSKTKWEGNNLIRSFFMSSPMVSPSRASENVEVYRISKDGNTLTYELSAKMEGGYGDPIVVRKLIFDRKP